MEKKIFGVTKYEKSIATYKYSQAGEHAIIFDGVDTIKVPRQAFYDQVRKYFSSDFKYIECDHKSTLQETRDLFISDANHMKRETDGVINLYKTGSNVPTALSLFYHFLNPSLIPEEITQEEARWVCYSTYGAITFAEQYDGEAYKYDVCSMYPSIMQDKYFVFPIKQGTFETMKEYKLYWTAIYRCTVERSTDPNKNKLFKYNFKPFYTSRDLCRAKELGLTVKLIQDGQPNVLKWERNQCATGSQLFGKFVKLLFGLKSKGVKRAKGILNCLWGALSKKNLITLTLNEDDENVTEIFANRQVLSVTPFGKNKMKVDMLRRDNMYDNDFARIAPFLLAKGRTVISRLMEPHISNVVFSHTDSMITKTKLNIPTGTNIGDLKYEGRCENVSITNCMKKTGEFLL